MGRSEGVSARAHKGGVQGGQVGDFRRSRRFKATAALRADCALADTSPASARLLGKAKPSQRAKRVGRFNLETVFEMPKETQNLPTSADHFCSGKSPGSHLAAKAAGKASFRSARLVGDVTAPLLINADVIRLA